LFFAYKKPCVDVQGRKRVGPLSSRGKRGKGFLKHLQIAEEGKIHHISHIRLNI